jgi:hypothetical protein
MAIEVGPDPAATVPADVKAPVVVLMMYVETSFESAFVTYANFPDGWKAIELELDPIATVPAAVKAPVVVLMMYVEML